MLSADKARSARPKRRKPSAPGAAPLFEVTVQDVGDLSDGDLRELVARLCTAELTEADLPTTSVTWGGDQRARDGGIDVRVQLSSGTTPPGLIPRTTTGFQVKATKMGGGDLQLEMCPKGVLRQSIRDLIRAKGSYIIATSDSTADEEYQKRVVAMRTALATEPGHEETHVDYYDVRRLADWTNQHRGIVAWVRNRLGRPSQGWKPYDQWVDTHGGQPQPFLPDEKHRLANPHDPSRKCSLIEGLTHVRNALRNGGSSVRLTGLSGVGKTRFAQALFEVEAAPEPLPTVLAVYTDTSQGPNPPPLAVLDELVASGRRTILVVDNCGSQLHNHLTARCKTSSRVSLLTIEYDIREDLPNETSVFHLETGSSELIEKVIGQQFPHISPVNVATIARFSDGNSRVAIALADSIGRKESLAGLSDRALFERLFWLGKEVQQDLMIAAQACALVYSFDAEDPDGELVQLAALTGELPETLYRHIAELKRRGLAQRRGVWRAVLPHAIANALARRALEDIRLPLIERYLVQGKDRLLRSFSRRLGYLHDAPEALVVVRKWLSAGELLGDLTNLTPELAEILTNVAPVDPEATLEAIERALGGPDAASALSPKNLTRTRIVRLLRSIAYESKFFKRCMDALLAFALAEAPDNRMDATRSVIESLFGLHLSGTHATTQQRTGWVRAALLSSDYEVRTIGLQCLSAALKCNHFSSHYGFEFGARARDFGWSPNGKDAHAWFASFIALSAEVGQSDTEISSAVRELLATHFRSLWVVAGMADELETAADALLDAGWERGWLAIRQTLRHDGKGMPAAIKTRLESLEERIKPQTLVGRVKAIVLSGSTAGVYFLDGETTVAGFERVDQTARELGELIAGDADAFAAVLPLVVRNEQGRQGAFGEGLAAGVDSIDDCWAALVSAFGATLEEERNVQVLRGFMHGVFRRDSAKFEALLDAAMERASFISLVPFLQLAAPLGDSGCTRLMVWMDNSSVPSWAFRYLGYSRATQKLSDDWLAQLLQRLSVKPDGMEVAVDVLSMHIFDNPNPVGPRVRQLGQALLTNVPLTQHDHGLDHALERLVEVFLQGREGEAAARALLTTVCRGFEDYSLSGYGLAGTLAALFKVQPNAALETLVGDGPDEGNTYFRRRSLTGAQGVSALSEVPIEMLVAWCEKGGPERWSHVAPLLVAFDSQNEQSDLHWPASVVTLLKRAPQPIEVARSLVELIEPMSWSGSRAEAIRQRLPLLDGLASELGSTHTEQIDLWRSQITRIMDREARRELDEHRARDERFE